MSTRGMEKLLNTSFPASAEDGVLPYKGKVMDAREMIIKNVESI